MPLTITADLAIEVDGVSARLVNDGSTMVLETDHPVAFARAAGLDRPRPSITAGVDALQSLPEAVVLRGPHGDIASAGAGAGNSWGRLISGRRDVGFHPSALLPPVVRNAIGVAMAGAAATILTGRARRRS